MFKFLRKKIAEVAFAYKMWADKKEIEDDFKQALNFAGLGNRNIMMQDEERQIAEGVIAMKVAINSLLKNKSAKSYDKTLRDIDNLLKYAQDVGSKQQKTILDLRKSIVVFKEKDLKSKEDKQKMINIRLNHYNQLHSKKLARDLIRQERQARKAGNSELADKLLKEWKEKYG